MDSAAYLNSDPVCTGCEHWRRIYGHGSKAYAACHCLLDTGKRRGSGATPCTKSDKNTQKWRSFYGSYEQSFR